MTRIDVSKLPIPTLFSGIGFGVLTLSGALGGPATSPAFMRRLRAELVSALST